MTFFHRLIQMSIAIGHFSSLHFTPLSKIPRSSYLFSPYQSGSYLLESTYHPDCRSSAAGIYTPGYSEVLFIWKCKTTLILAEALQSPRSEPCQPGTGRKLPQKGWKKQREETPVCHLWSANNFQPLENLKRVWGHFFFPQCALLCFQPADMKSSADDGDASGRDFSNWGGGEEAASGERGRKRSLYKAGKFKNIRREKYKRERAKFRKFCNCEVLYRSELRPSQTLNQHSSHGSNSKPRCVHPTTFLKCMKEFSGPHGTVQQSPEVWNSRKVFGELGSTHNNKITHCMSPAKLYHSFCFSNCTKRTKMSSHLLT